MATSDDDRFRLRPFPPRSRTGPGTQRFVSQVARAMSRAGARTARAGDGRPASTFGRGRVAAAMAGDRWDRHARRVVIKSRFVVLRRLAARSVGAHLRYIERDGVTRDGRRGQAYGPDADRADLKAFEERGRGDRHQFRLIVSVEDAPQVEDLRGFTRELLRRMAGDLETPLDWVAVDHWDTDNPHTHVVLRGRVGEGAAGHDLVIAPDYMAHGMRMRASAIATEWLGPRTELEIRQGLEREVAQERLTSLDRALLRQAPDGLLDLRGSPASPQRQSLLRARLQRLEAMGLARRLEAHRWQLASGMDRALVALGERGDVLRTVQRALKGEQREANLDATPHASITGCIVAKGMAGELHEHGYLVVDGVDGRAHYLRLPVGIGTEALREFPMGGIVSSQVPTGRAVDRGIAAVSRDGVYVASAHQASLEQSGERGARDAVAAHVRRLEALRRAGLVERLDDGVWRVPPDLVHQGMAHDARSGRGIELQSRQRLERQVQALGATWLDRQLVAGGPPAVDSGFGAQVREALRRREDFLVEQGLAVRERGEIKPVRGLLLTLRNRELAAVGRTLQARTGRVYRPLADGDSASGVYRRRMDLVSGRFVVLDDGLGFSLVPWRAVVEPRRGMQVSASVRGLSVTWQLARQRGLGV